MDIKDIEQELKSRLKKLDNGEYDANALKLYEKGFMEGADYTKELRLGEIAHYKAEVEYWQRKHKELISIITTKS